MHANYGCPVLRPRDGDEEPVDPGVPYDDDEEPVDPVEPYEDDGSVNEVPEPMSVCRIKPVDCCVPPTASLTWLAASLARFCARSITESRASPIS